MAFMHAGNGSGYKKEVISEETTSFVRRMRLELTRSCDHYPLKVACIPISPPARVPRTGLEPAHLAACAPETHASTNSAIWAKKKSGKRDSNSRPRPWQGRALPTELFPHSFYSINLDQRFLTIFHLSSFIFRKRVQRYCFFFIYANFLRKKCKKNAFSLRAPAPVP